MYAKVTSLGVTGLAGYIVQVEADLSGGLPQFNLVGLPDSAVKESSERVRSAIKNLHYEWPASRITINLAPADVRKTGPVYDLPVFVGIMAAQGKLPAPGSERAFLGELGLDGTTQLDDGTMTKDEFFVRLAEDSKLPRTSQPSPASFMQVYEDAAAAGDEVLVITIGQKLSGTYQCAHLAAADVGLQVHIVDSEAASQAEALLVREAVRLRDEEGLTAEEIAAVLEQFKKRVRIVAVVDSLKHLQKGGRLPAAVAIVGGALGIKPVLALKDGEIKLVDKGRGRPGALVAMFKQLDALGGIDPRYGYTLLYSDNKQLIAPVHHYMHQNLQLTGGRVAQLGPTIGTHVGPGVVGVVFVAKE